MARPERFELPTTKFVAWYSIQLSYGRIETDVLRTVHGANVQSASMPPPHARRDSSPDCRKRLAFDQLSYGRIETLKRAANYPWSLQSRQRTNWRRGRDSNPRSGFVARYSLSRGAPSASRAPLRIIFDVHRGCAVNQHAACNWRAAQGKCIPHRVKRQHVTRQLLAASCLTGPSPDSGPAPPAC